MRARWFIASVLGVALGSGCGDDGAPPPPPPRAAAASIEATAAAPDDLVVATVNGQPVWGSCVAAQVHALGASRQAALEQCVSFELLAQAADARGLRADPDVVETWRREMVRALIQQDLGPIDSFEDLPEGFRNQVLARMGDALDWPPLRAGHYARVELAPEVPRGSPEDEAGRRAAEAAYAELKDDPGVLPDQLFAVLRRHGEALAPTLTVVKSPDDPYLTPIGDSSAVRPAVVEFREALWAIPAAGMISPPVRTAWGWDLILFWGDLPAQDMRPKAFASVRTRYFLTWSKQIGEALGVQVTVDEARLSALAEDAAAQLTGPTRTGP